MGFEMWKYFLSLQIETKKNKKAKNLNNFK